MLRNDVVSCCWTVSVVIACLEIYNRVRACWYLNKPTATIFHLRYYALGVFAATK